MERRADICFEVAFECGHKIGGIYTVISSKSADMLRYYGKDNYYTVGFYSRTSLSQNFQSEKTPQNFKPIFEELKNDGIDCYYGKWIAANNCKIILLDTEKYREKGVWNKKAGKMMLERNIHLIKEKLWRNYKIDSLNAGFDFDEPVAWSTAAGKLIRIMYESLFPNKKVVAHFHEWLSGPGLLYLVDKKVPVGVTFTNHATRVGRAMATSGVDVIKMVNEGLKNNKTISKEDAKKYGVLAQHDVEASSAKFADVFTSVSELVGNESKYILGKYPDVITPNALDFSRYPTMEELIAHGLRNRYRIHRFLEAYFSPYYAIGPKKSKVFFTMGRYEYYNKGIDLFVDALGELNKRLRNKNSRKNVFAFIWVPSNTGRPKVEVMENMINFDKIESLIIEKIEEIKRNMLSCISDRKEMTPGEIFGKPFSVEYAPVTEHFLSKSNKKPPVCAYELNYPENKDIILNKLKENNLDNSKESNVKVIFYPVYLSPDDMLLGMHVSDAVMGTTMGVFPSRYEPWGYTVMEAGAMMSMSVTTNSSGVGRFILKNTDQSQKPGIQVVDVENKTQKEIVLQIANIMEEIVSMDDNTLLQKKIDARRVAELNDWEKLVDNYINAHNISLEKTKARI